MTPVNEPPVATPTPDLLNTPIMQAMIGKIHELVQKQDEVVGMINAMDSRVKRAEGTVSQIVNRIAGPPTAVTPASAPPPMITATATHMPPPPQTSGMCAVPLGTPPPSAINEGFIPPELLPMTRPSRTVVSPMTEAQAQAEAAKAMFATPTASQPQPEDGTGKINERNVELWIKKPSP